MSKSKGGAAGGKAAVPTNANPTLGFGVPATSDPHHFKVIIPRSNTDTDLIASKPPRGMR